MQKKFELFAFYVQNYQGYERTVKYHVRNMKLGLCFGTAQPIEIVTNYTFI